MDIAPEQPRPVGCATRFGTQLLLIWTAVLGFLVQLSVTLALLAAPLAGQLELPPIDRAAVLWWAYIDPLLVALPALLMATRGGSSRYRAVGRALVWGAALTAMLTAIRQTVPLDAVNSSAFARVIVALLFGLPLLIRRAGAPGRWRSAALAILLGAILALPALVWGALGSWLDTTRAIFESITLGIVGASVLAILRPVFDIDRRSAAADIWLAGATLSAVLINVAGAWGQDNQNLLLILVLPILGFPAAALARSVEPGAWLGWGAAALLLALAACAPLALFDPREMLALNLLEGETATYAFLSALVAALLGLIFGLIGASIGARPRAAGSIVTWTLAGILLLGDGAIYALDGQPGMYGDRFFVIMRDQANLADVAAMSDLSTRRAAVYKKLTEQADRTQANLRAFLDARHIGYTPYYLINAIEVRGDVPLRLLIQSRADVDRVLLSPELRPLPKQLAPDPSNSVAPNGPTWGIRAIHADRVWNELGVTGKGIVVGQSDSGVDWHHPALQAQYRGRDGHHTYNWIDPWLNRPEPYDLGGHGTHTLGSIIGSGGIGVAPGATWIGCTNEVRNMGNPAYYLNCMQFLLAPYPPGADPLRAGRPDLAADVSNNSWGCPPEEGCDARALEQGVAALDAAGIFVVASAGNDGPYCNSLTDPITIYSGAFSVGAVDEQGELAPFSSRGPNSELPDERRGPDVVAPGVGVVSAWPGGGYSQESGTSMAGPHVAGVVALMWSANPKLRGDIKQTSEILRTTAQPYVGPRPLCSSGQRPDPATGYGMVDAFAAVQAALRVQ